MDARRLATPFLIGLALLAVTSPAYAHQPAINVACGDIPGLRAAIAAANDAPGIRATRRSCSGSPALTT